MQTLLLSCEILGTIIIWLPTRLLFGDRRNANLPIGEHPQGEENPKKLDPHQM